MALVCPADFPDSLSVEYLDIPVESLPPGIAPPPHADAAEAFARRRSAVVGKSGGAVMGYLLLSEAQRRLLETACPDDGGLPLAILEVERTSLVRSLSAGGASVLTEEGMASPETAGAAEGRHTARVVAWSSGQSRDGTAAHIAVIEAAALAVAALRDARTPARATA